MPTGMAPHKEIADDPGAGARLAMARLAAAEEPNVEASDLEVSREGPSYAYETLEQLAEREGDTELVFVMGADAAAGLGSWREPRRVLELAALGVARREGSDDGDVLSSLDELGARDRATLVDMPRLDVSSSNVRERAAAGRPLRHLVPDAVAAYIGSEGLYRP
jgi:nicotinate-nucleotide adenylyltransferase